MVDCKMRGGDNDVIHTESRLLTLQALTKVGQVINIFFFDYGLGLSDEFSLLS